MTSFDVSRGRLESLVGKRFVVVWLRVYFARIQSLFAFISLTHKIMILFCIGAGYIAHCVDGSFYFVTIKKKAKRRKICLNAFSCKQWGRRSLKNYQPCFVLIVDISHHPAFIATHTNTSYTAECTTNCPNGCI